MSNSQTTDQLNKDLYGDWEECYHDMHVHAVKLECDLTTTKSENILLKEQIQLLNENVIDI